MFATLMGLVFPLAFRSAKPGSSSSSGKALEASKVLVGYELHIFLCGVATLSRFEAVQSTFVIDSREKSRGVS
jgi:hypothetical protein